MTVPLAPYSGPLQLPFAVAPYSGPLSQHGLSAEGAKAKIVYMKEYHHSLYNLSKCHQVILSKQSIYF